MKFLEHLKQFNKLVIEENARLKGIYDQLISEAKEENIKVDETEEEVKENDLLKNKPHNAHITEGEEEKKVDECGETEDKTTSEADTSFSEDETAGADFFTDDGSETKQIPEDEFMNAGSEETTESEETSDDEKKDEVAEDEKWMSAENYFESEKKDEVKDEVTEGDACPECGKNPCVCEKDDEKKDEVTEAEDPIPSVEEFFDPNAKVATTESEEKSDEADDVKEDADADEVTEGEEDMMTYDEFFEDETSDEEKKDEVTEGDACPECGKNPCVCEKDDEVTADDFLEDDEKSSEEEKKDEVTETEEDKKETSVEEKDDDKKDDEVAEDDKLDESLEQYRKMNARLFQD